MSYECFEVSVDDGVAHLRMSRPERRNAMTLAFWRELPEIVRGLDARVLVLSLTGPPCCGGGVYMATACCLRYAARDAYFVIQEINIGMMADVGTFNRMPKQLPEAVVRELGYTGERLTAERAERLGFVNGLFDTHEQLVGGGADVA